MESIRGIKCSRLLIGLSVGSLLFATGRTTFAAALAADDSSNAPYNSNNFSNGQNGGYGFNPWVLTTDTTNGGFGGTFVYDSTQNGTVPSNGVNVANRSFGTYAGNGGIENLNRSFTADAVSGSAALQLNQHSVSR